MHPTGIPSHSLIPTTLMKPPSPTLAKTLPIIFLALLGACASDENPAIPSPVETPTLASRSMVSDDIIDAETAEYAAYKVMNAPVNGVEVTNPKNVSYSLPLTNSEGMTVMYAVNFESEGGYVLLSASKKTLPVVAVSEKGNYNPNMLSSLFISRLIGRATQHITESFHYPEDSIGAYAGHWAPLLPPIAPVSLRLRSTTRGGYQDIIDMAVNQWYDEGCEVYDAVKWATNGYPECKFLPGLDNLLSTLWMQVSWADNKPMNELSFIVIRHNYFYEKTDAQCAPVTTNWKTISPYNAAVPGGLPLSSEAVALGQIIHYFNDPVINNFSASASNPLQNTTEIANFLYDVAKNVRTVFGPSYSYASFENVKAALSNTYHYGFNYGEFNEGNLIYSINNGSPAIIIDKDESGRSHAWICDGYRLASHRRDYYLMAPLGQPQDIFYGFECVGQWDENGVTNFEFENKTDEILIFSPFADISKLDGFFFEIKKEKRWK